MTFFFNQKYNLMGFFLYLKFSMCFEGLFFFRLGQRTKITVIVFCGGIHILPVLITKSEYSSKSLCFSKKYSKGETSIFTVFLLAAYSCLYISEITTSMKLVTW